jgi:hypothetical protein
MMMKQPTMAPPHSAVHEPSPAVSRTITRPGSIESERPVLLSAVGSPTSAFEFAALASQSTDALAR